jgi:DNA topoisomerase-3
MGPILAKMKECFQRANAEAHKLDEAIARHFTRLGVNDANLVVLQVRFSECGICRNLMTLKQTRPTNNENQSRKKLLFCATCQLGLPLPRGSMTPVTENDNGVGGPTKCPICQYQVVRVGPGEGYTGNGYTYCPKCFSDPPLEHGGVAGGDNFRCFNCQHPTCSLASGTPGGEVEVFPCPFCHQRSGGKVMLRKPRGFVLSCNQYSGQERCPYSIWLPNESRTVSVPEGDENICRHCSIGGRVVRKLHFLWKPGSVPPHLGRECTACVLCDTVFREDMSVRLPQPGQVLTNQRRTQAGGRGRGRGTGTGRGGGRGTRNWDQNNGDRGRGAGNTCYRCGQPGHFASNCPNNQ